MRLEKTHEFVKAGEQRQLFPVVSLIESDFFRVGDQSGVDVTILPFQTLFLDSHLSDRLAKMSQKNASY